MKIPYNILIQIKMSVRPYFKGFTLIFFFYNCRKQDYKADAIHSHNSTYFPFVFRYSSRCAKQTVRSTHFLFSLISLLSFLMYNTTDKRRRPMDFLQQLNEWGQNGILRYGLVDTILSIVLIVLLSVLISKYLTHLIRRLKPRNREFDS